MSPVCSASTRSLSGARDDSAGIATDEAPDDRDRSNEKTKGGVSPHQNLEQSQRYPIASSHLTAVLASAHKAYPRNKYHRKMRLVHPMTIKLSRGAHLSSDRAVVDQTGPRYKHVPRPRRGKLSSMFAVYMEAAETPSRPMQLFLDDLRFLSSRPDKTLSMQTPTTLLPPALTLSQRQPPIDGALSSRAAASLQDLESIELESIKRFALYQSKTLPLESLTHMASRGYSFKDFAAWKWVLSGLTAEDAAARLEFFVVPSATVAANFAAIPIFVFLRLLRREDISQRAFALLLRQAWRLMGPYDQGKSDSTLNFVTPAAGPRQLPRFDLDSLALMVIRLLRLARKVWPMACVKIASLWTSYARIGLVVREVQQDEMSAEDSARLTFCYNRILSILALPANKRPFQSLHHRQRAQFMVIRQMNTFKPPLTIDREGYRAVVRVQLAHSKTVASGSGLA